VALWFGGVDDLWKLGKPVGRGGPWRNTDVTAGIPSDPYLMTGYDQKSFALSHNSAEPVTFTLQVDIDGRGTWVDYRSFQVQRGETLSHQLPTGFSASWIRAKSDQSTTATLIFTYQ
jgi:hypothetical protein